MRYLEKLDFSSKSNLTFLINGKQSFPLAIGGILTIILFIASIYLLKLFSFDIINKMNPIIITQKIIDQDNINISLNQSKINVVIQPYYYNSTKQVFGYDSSLFSIVGFNSTYQVMNDGMRSETSESIQLKQCEEADFDPSLKDFFRVNKFNSTAYCMGSKDFNILGQPSSSMYKFLEFRVEQCDNEVTCKNKTQRDLEISNYKVSVYFTYTMPNVLKYGNPNSVEIYKNTYDLSPMSIRKDDYLFSADVLFTDDNLFFSQSYFTTPINFINLANMYSSIFYSTLDEEEKDIYLSFTYRVNSSYTYLKRIYKKVPEVTAQLLPFIHIGLFFIQILCYKYRSYKMNNKIINDSFYYSTNEGRSEIIKLKTQIESKNLSSNNNLNSGKVYPLLLNNNNNSISRNEINYSPDTRFKSILQHRREIRKSETPLQINKKVTYFGKILKFCSFKTERHIYRELDSRINYALEISSYLALYNDFEKFKSLLLNKDQKNALVMWRNIYSQDYDDNIIADWCNKTDKINEDTFASYNNLLGKNISERSQADSKLILKITNFLYSI